MVERGLDGRLLVEPGLRHDSPEGFEMELNAAIEFVLNNVEIGQ